MLKLSKIKILSVGLVLILISIVWPFYDGLAHKGKVSFPPFYKYIEIPKDNPTDQTLHQHAYKETGNSALNLLTQHKISINAPAISAAVAIDGELVWAGASGWSDIAAQIPVTTDTQFRIGSTAKALTATALARLVDANLINIDESISSYMNDLPNKKWGKMTARQLVSHTSGLPHYKENTDYLGLYKTISLSSRYEQVQDALAIFDDSELLFEPGEQFSYSTFGSVLLSAVMENAVNTPYLDIMQKQIFTPLGMHSTMAEFKGEDSKNLATFYWNNKGSSAQVRKWRAVDLSHRLAGGGFISTSSDLVKMGIAYLQDDYISAKTRQAFWTPQTLPDGTQPPNGYSLGWRFMKIKVDEAFGEVTLANHGGVSRGAQSWLMVIPKHNMSIALNINANTDVFWDFAKVSMQLAKMFILARNETILVDQD
jgi:serine beta-lactamase-like protein LACTB